MDDHPKVTGDMDLLEEFNLKDRWIKFQTSSLSQSFAPYVKHLPGLSLSSIVISASSVPKTQDEKLLESLGIKFFNNNLFQNIEGSLEKIIVESPPPPPDFLSQIVHFPPLPLESLRAAYTFTAPHSSNPSFRSSHSSHPPPQTSVPSSEATSERKHKRKKDRGSPDSKKHKKKKKRENETPEEREERRKKKQKKKEKRRRKQELLQQQQLQQQQLHHQQGRT